MLLQYCRGVVCATGEVTSRGLTHVWIFVCGLMLLLAMNVWVSAKIQGHIDS